MGDNLAMVLEDLYNLTADELNEVINAAKKQKEQIEKKAKRVAAGNLVKAFVDYKEASGKDTIKIYNCRGWNNMGSTKTDAIISINDLFVDDNGDICHTLIY